MLLGLDLLAGAVKASLSYARLPYLMSLREGREEKVDRTVGVIEKPRLRSSLRLAMAFFHFLFGWSLAYHLAGLWRGFGYLAGVVLSRSGDGLGQYP